MYLAPIAEVEVQCGPQALACYSASQSLLIAPAEEVEEGVTPEAVVTHEYGHHIAAHRSNAPWTAIDTGTKRWASYLQVCAKADTGTLFPGAEDFSHYQLNPGEGFAEQYRVLNQRRAGLPETAWDVVAQSLYPDDTYPPVARAGHRLALAGDRADAHHGADRSERLEAVLHRGHRARRQPEGDAARAGEVQALP